MTTEDKSARSEAAGVQSPDDKKREQVAKQCDAIAHMATALAGISRDYATLLRGGVDLPLDIVGDRTAGQMEVLGDMLNDMDAVAPDDEWLNPIFAEAHRLWPQQDQASPTPTAPVSAGESQQ